jgi:hypothetical protein
MSTDDESDGGDATAHSAGDDSAGDPTGHDPSAEPDDGKTSTVDEASSASKDDPDDCAEVPRAAHVVLVAEHTLLVQLSFAVDDASQLAHTFTISNGDGSYSKTLALATDCTPGDVDGTSLLTFEELSEDQTYTLQYAVNGSTYTIFAGVLYDESFVSTLNAQAAANGDSSSDDAPQDDPPWLEDSYDDGGGDSGSGGGSDGGSGDGNGGSSYESGDGGDGGVHSDDVDDGTVDPGADGVETTSGT